MRSGSLIIAAGGPQQKQKPHPEDAGGEPLGEQDLANSPKLEPKPKPAGAMPTTMPMRIERWDEIQAGRFGNNPTPKLEVWITLAQEYVEKHARMRSIHQKAELPTTTT